MEKTRLSDNLNKTIQERTGSSQIWFIPARIIGVTEQLLSEFTPDFPLGLVQPC